MCGYFGIYHKQQKEIRQGAHLSLAHRGPDSSNEWQSGGVYFKHYRLAILGGIAGGQPMHSHDEQWCMLFNGEIYNYIELADEIAKPELKNSGDSRVLLACIEKLGLAGISRFNGMFSIALFNKKNQDLYLVRDRFGVKPLYYTVREKQIHFASEIKALIHESSTISEKVSEDYLAFGQYPSDGLTFYQDIREVPPGCYIHFSGTREETIRYYDFDSHVTELESLSLDIDEYLSLLNDAIKIRLRSDRAVSLHLSSGVDSLGLLSLLREVWDKPYPLTCVSMGFAENAYDESSHAELNAHKGGFPHQKSVLMSHEVPALAEELQFFQDEPYGGIPTIAYYKMNKEESREGYVVTLEGQGGDEAHLGYMSHVLMAAYDRILAGQRDTTFSSLLTILNMTESRAVESAERFINSGFAAHTDLTAQRCGEARRGSRHERGWLRSVQLFDILKNKLPRTLRFNDRASAACSREIRCPLLDYRVLAYGVALPVEKKIKPESTKALLRSVIARSGFEAAPGKSSIVTPQSAWFLGDLQGWAREQLDLLALNASTATNEKIAQARHLLSQKKIENSFSVWQLINVALMGRDLEKKKEFLRSGRQPGIAPA